MTYEDVFVFLQPFGACVLHFPTQPEIRGPACPDSAPHQGTVPQKANTKRGAKRPLLHYTSLLSVVTEIPRQACAA